jgi:hypothetical protein
MCIVIDVNRLPSVFDGSSSDHIEFQPILDWIGKRRTKIIYGGSKYNYELKKMPRYFGILTEMKRGGEVKELGKDTVDRIQDDINRRTTHKNFNDQAILAIIIASKTRLLCSHDTTSLPFIRASNLYPRGIEPPKIYRDRRDHRVLYHRYLNGHCGPCCP